MSALWKEIVELLAAGSQIVPLADNEAVYRRLEERLDELRAANDADASAKAA